MGISLRDNKGQAIVEYVLVLIVAVTIILGGIYKLNSAFKVWANNYFGDYLGCLLETGELPTISGTGGDSGLCNQFFKPFTLADGRPLIPQGKSSASNTSKEGNGGGSREASGGNRGGGGGGGGGGGRVGGFNAGKNFGKGKGAGGSGKDGGGKPAFTGDTSTKSYSSYNSRYNRSNSGSKSRLNQDFAFDDSREKEQRRNLASSTKSANDGQREGRVLRNSTKKTKDGEVGDENGFSFGDFIRWLIIIAIILAILLFLGGQGLQISKSME